MDDIHCNYINNIFEKSITFKKIQLHMFFNIKRNDDSEFIVYQFFFYFDLISFHFYKSISTIKVFVQFICSKE